MEKVEKVKVGKVKREKSTSTQGQYVRNADLLPAVIEAKAAGVVTTKLIKMIEMIAERYSRKFNFVNYSFREDMVASAVLNLCNNALKFDTDKYNNPFAYYTSAIHNSFLQYIGDEKKHRQIRDQLLLDAGSNPSFNYQEKSISDSDSMTYSYDVTSEVEEAPLKKNEDALAGLKIDDETGELIAPKKEVPYRLQHKEPTNSVVYKASEMVYDAELGYYVKKVV